MAGRLCCILVEKVLVIGKSIAQDLSYKVASIKHFCRMNKILILNMLYFSGIISSLISIVTINLSNVEAQWIETPPRYTCPKGKFHFDTAYQNTYCKIGTYDDMHEYNFFYLRKIGFYTLAIVLDRVMMASTLNVTTPIQHPSRLDYDR